MKNVGVRACGTIRANRKFVPKNLQRDKAMVRGDYDHRVANGIAYFKWMDSKPVTVVSNFHGTGSTNIMRRLGDSSKKEFKCPLAVKEYNMYMGGVDQADFKCAVNGRNRKSTKWWHRIFFGLLDRTLANSFIVYKKVGKENLSMLTFRRLFVQALMTLSKPPKVGRPLGSSPLPASKKRRKSEYSVAKSICLENRGCHWLIFDTKRGRCEVCSQSKVESRPYSKCSTCQIFLCCNDKKNCFVIFHDAE